MNWKKIWENKSKIFEGVFNTIFKRRWIEKIAKERMEICSLCPSIDRIGTSCEVPGTQPCCHLCGCKLTFKTRSLSSSCDDNRWKAHMTEDQQDELYTKLNYNPDEPNI